MPTLFPLPVRVSAGEGFPKRQLEVVVVYLFLGEAQYSSFLFYYLDLNNLSMSSTYLQQRKRSRSGCWTCRTRYANTPNLHQHHTSTQL